MALILPARRACGLLMRAPELLHLIFVNVERVARFDLSSAGGSRRQTVLPVRPVRGVRVPAIALPGVYLFWLLYRRKVLHRRLQFAFLGAWVKITGSRLFHRSCHCCRLTIGRRRHRRWRRDASDRACRPVFSRRMSGRTASNGGF